jgi:Inclusion body protein
MSNNIDILCAIDTTDILGTYSNPSKDPNNPTGITP